jgi:hypothetical protein
MNGAAARAASPQLNLSFVDQTGKIFKGSVIGALPFPGKTAPRKLAAFQVVTDAVAADAFSGAGFIGTCTGCQIFFFFAFHNYSS